VRKAVGTLVALLGTIAAAVGGFSLLGLIYASVGVDRHFEIRGWLATLGLGLLGTLLFVAGYWVRVDKAELRQLLTDQFYGPDAILAPKGEGARPTTMWGAYIVWGAVSAVGYAIDGFVGLVVVGLGVLVVAQLLIWSHELGHLLCALALRMRPWLIVVGGGPQLSRRLGGIQVYWGLWPTHGWVGIDRLGRRWWRWRLLLLYSGGLIVSSGALCVLAGLCGALFDPATTVPLARLAWVVVALCFVGLLVILVLNAIPQRARMPGFEAHTDGFWILNALRLPEEHEGFLRHSMALNRLSRGLLDVEPQKVSERLRDFSKDPRPDAFRAKALDLVASRGVFHRTPEWLQLANECISEAVALYPDRTTLRLTRGLVRAEQGDLEGARPDLELAYKSGEIGNHRGIAAAYLALVRSEVGEDHEAFLEEGKRLGADAWALDRVLERIQARAHHRGQSIA
jgi:hypothetical protein